MLLTVIYIQEKLQIVGGVLSRCTVIKDSPVLGEVASRTPSNASATDLLAGLTFNVRTSAEEQKAKDQLVLPYTQ